MTSSSATQLDSLWELKILQMKIMLGINDSELDREWVDYAATQENV